MKSRSTLAAGCAAAFPCQDRIGLLLRAAADQLPPMLAAHPSCDVLTYNCVCCQWHRSSACVVSIHAGAAGVRVAERPELVAAHTRRRLPGKEEYTRSCTVIIAYRQRMLPESLEISIYGHICCLCRVFHTRCSCARGPGGRRRGPKYLRHQRCGSSHHTPAARCVACAQALSMHHLACRQSRQGSRTPEGDTVQSGDAYSSVSTRRFQGILSSNISSFGSSSPIYNPILLSMQQKAGHRREVVQLGSATAAPGLLASLARDGELRTWDVPSSSCTSCSPSVATSMVRFSTFSRQSGTDATPRCSPKSGTV